MKNRLIKTLFFIFILSLSLTFFSCANECRHEFLKTSETLPNCLESGVAEYTCILCGESREESLKENKDNHLYSKEWETSEEYHWKKPICNHNAEVFGKAEHTIKDGVCVVCSFVADRGEVLNNAISKLKGITLFNDRFDFTYVYGDYTTSYKSDGKNLWIIVVGKENESIVYSRSSYIFPTKDNKGTAFIQTVDTAFNWEGIVSDKIENILGFALLKNTPANINDFPFYNVCSLLTELSFSYDSEKDAYYCDRYKITLKDGKINAIELFDSEGGLMSSIKYTYENEVNIIPPQDYKKHEFGEWEYDHDGNQFRKCTCHEKDFAVEYPSVPKNLHNENSKPNINVLIENLKQKRFFGNEFAVKFTADSETKTFICDGNDLYYYFERNEELFMGGYFIVDNEKVKIFNYKDNTWSIFSDLDLETAVEKTVGTGNGENSYLGQVIKLLENKEYTFVDSFVKCFVADGVKIYVEKINGEWQIKEIEGLNYKYHTVVFGFKEYDFTEPELGHVFGEWKENDNGEKYRECDCGRGIEHSGVYPTFTFTDIIPEETNDEQE